MTGTPHRFHWHTRENGRKVVNSVNHWDYLYCNSIRSGGWEGERRDVRNERLGGGKISHSIHHHLLSLSTREKHWVVFSKTERERDRWRGSGEIE